MATTKVATSITYHKKGTQPPVYVAGSFSDPPWQPYEMRYSPAADGEFDFHHKVNVDPSSRIEYKFRLGEGEWWALNESAPTVTDEHGNQNNVLQAPAKLMPEPPTSMFESPVEYTSRSTFKSNVKNDSLNSAGITKDPEPVPLFSHECAGLYEEDEVPGAGFESGGEYIPPPSPIEDEVDVNDPTLESFPSNKEDIMSTVRRVSTGLNEDQTMPDGVPPSPIITSARGSFVDPTDVLAATGNITGAHDDTRLELPEQRSRGSFGQRSGSSVSLGSITEENEGVEEVEEEEEPSGDDTTTMRSFECATKGMPQSTTLAVDENEPEIALDADKLPESPRIVVHSADDEGASYSPQGPSLKAMHSEIASVSSVDRYDGAMTTISSRVILWSGVVVIGMAWLYYKL